MTTSQNPEKNSGPSSRSNPACLEINVTLRSLPSEAGGPEPSIREEGKTVIVFDNGAVLRIGHNLPVGQTVILSNPNGREVVCRAINGQNLPSVKGYIEVEFVEPVKDFWSLRQDQIANPVSVTVVPTSPPNPPGVREALVPPPPPPRVAAPVDASTHSPAASSGRGPSFEDIPGLLSPPVSDVARESKLRPVNSGSEKTPKVIAEYSRTEVAESTSVASWSHRNADLATEKSAFPAAGETSSHTSASSTPPRDFMGNGLMAYEQPRPSGGSSARTLLIAAALALVLAGAGGAWFFMHWGIAFVRVAKTSDVNTSVPDPTVAKSAPAPFQAPQEDAARGTTQPLAQAKTQARPFADGQPQSIASIAAVPALVRGPASMDSGADPANLRRQEENATATKQPNTSSPRRPAIPNLKMNSPSAPIRNPAAGDGSAPITEIASTEAVGATPTAGLLTSSGRTYNPPAPPPLAPAPAPVVAPRTVREPKLISSTRLVYPIAARQSHVDGIVTVSANIDENGKVVGAKALSGPMLLRQAAVDSVTQWKYAPALTDGKPVPSQVTVSVQFRLN